MLSAVKVLYERHSNHKNQDEVDKLSRSTFRGPVRRSPRGQGREVTILHLVNMQRVSLLTKRYPLDRCPL